MDGESTGGDLAVCGFCLRTPTPKSHGCTCWFWVRSCKSFVAAIKKWSVREVKWKVCCAILGVARPTGNGTKQWVHKYAMVEKLWGHGNMGMHTSCNCTYLSCHYYATFAWCYLPVGFSLVPNPCITCIVC